MKRHLINSIIFGGLLIGSQVGMATIIHVPADQPSIQAGIDLAVEGDTVLVANGTYTGSGNENLDFLGKGITVRSENGSGSCIIQGGPSSLDPAVRFQSCESVTSILDGFSFIDFEYNGAISCTSGSSPQIRNCQFISNSSSVAGAGVYCDLSSPVIENCSFHQNSSGMGAGIYCQGSSPAINGCSFTSNSASAGSALYVLLSSPTITDCVLSNNNTAQAALHVERSGFTHVANCEISNNETAGFLVQGTDSSYLIEDSVISGNNAYGIIDESWELSRIIDCTVSSNMYGGIYSVAGDLRLMNCEILDNTNNADHGGGFHIAGGSTILENCLISGNSTADWGGGLYVESADVTLKNCTITGNSASLGGNYSSISSNITIMESILWANIPIDPYLPGGGTPLISYSDIQQISGIYPGTGNINSDPLFVAGSGGGYYLSQTASGQTEDSPCVNGGSSSADVVCYPSDSPVICLNQMTTRSDQEPDDSTADMGYHHLIPPPDLPAMSPAFISILLLFIGLYLKLSKRKPD